MEKHQSSLSDTPDETKVGFSEQTIDDNVKVKENKDFSEEITKCEDDKKYPLFDYFKAPEPFPVRMIPHGICTSSDSDSDSDSDSGSGSDFESEAVAEKVNSPKHMEHPPKESEEDTSDYDFTDITSDKYLRKNNNKDPPLTTLRHLNRSTPFPVRMIPHGICTSSDSDSDTDSDSDLDSESEDKSELQNVNSPKGKMEFQSSAISEDDQTPAKHKEESTRLDFPPSSVLVKHGMKRPAEADAGDKDSKRPREIALQTSDEENKGGGSTVFL